jgi:hypothetical protein
MHIKLVKISTTSYEEEDFLLVTSLSDEQIEAVIKPRVEEERNSDGSVFYSNDDLWWLLKDVYPNEFMSVYTEDTIDKLVF